MKIKPIWKVPALVIVGIIAAPFILAAGAISAAYYVGRAICEDGDENFAARKKP